MLKLLLCLIIAHKLDKGEHHHVFIHETVMCTKHPGNGLLLWSDGNMLCYDCGLERYGK